MMRKPSGHREKYLIKSEISRSNSDDGTAARTRPFSFDEIMLRRKNKKQSEIVEDQRVFSEVVSDHVESDRHIHRHRHRHRDNVVGREQRVFKEPIKVNSRRKEDSNSKIREDKIIENEYKESYNPQIRSKIVNDNAKDRRIERSVHEKRKNQDRSNADFDHEYRKKYVKESPVKETGKYENYINRRTQNGYGERGRELELKKWHDPDTSEKKQKKSTFDSRHDDLKSRSKRSRSREHERDKSKRSNSPSSREHKQRLSLHEDLSSNSSKDRKKISNNKSTTRLGGYSPRKRRTEAAVKTPSPTNHSPEKKNPRWDPPPVKIETNLPSLSNKHEVTCTVQATPSIQKATCGIVSSIPSIMNVSVDSVQLTQATRPKRRIYVENLANSVTEEDVMKWLTGFLRPYGVNHVQGANPCISCIVNKEKGQAVVEFLRPEDASSALSFDGKYFCGNIVKIRRPKDYVETTTGVLDKPLAGALSLQNIVQDSPNKIFIGGISKAITSEMLMVIASAFGPLKAYHFDRSRAFVEYADQSVTVKACVGLNGMKLGGQFLTVTQAIPDASSLENHVDQPFYGTPVHAQPLLEKPTRVLKLNNLMDPHTLSSVSELELEEILEDIRLECARFGMVKSIKIIKQPDMPTNSDTIKVSEEANSMADEVTTEPLVKVKEEVKCENEPENLNVDGIVGNKHENKMAKDETRDTTLEEKPNQITCAINQLELNDSKPIENIKTENKSIKTESHETRKHNLNDVFEVGCVLVEYKRTEASSMAAHCLHGRVFDGRIVSVEYVAYDVCCTMFHN